MRTALVVVATLAAALAIFLPWQHELIAGALALFIGSHLIPPSAGV